jgi:hypothetical protein
MSADPAALPLDDAVDEGRRLVSACEAAGVRLRLLGGAAFGLHIHSPIPDRLRRVYGDVDAAVGARRAENLARLLPALGYAPDVRFNALHGEKRFLFHDPARGRKLDVFVGSFSMCHTMSLEARLPEHGSTLAPADLLLTKLQVVELNEKDMIDLLVLLAGHEVAPSLDDDTIDVRRIAAVCAADWGWSTTVGDNLDRIAAAAARLLEPAGSARIAQRTGLIAAAIEEAPKSRAWRLRAMIGRRMVWYMLPEEVG